MSSEADERSEVDIEGLYSYLPASIVSYLLDDHVSENDADLKVVSRLHIPSAHGYAWSLCEHYSMWIIQ